MRKPKLTYKMVEQAVEMKSHGLSNVDICAGLGIAEGTFYRWLREDDTKLKRALKQGLKKAEAEYKETLLQSIMATATPREEPAVDGGRLAAGAQVPRRVRPDHAQGRGRGRRGAQDHARRRGARGWR